MSSTKRVAIVGAGLAGLACARHLQNGIAGSPSVTIFEKSRSLGGRCATKTNFEGTPIDHGAPYFKLSSPSAEQLVCPLVSDLRTLPPDSIIDPTGKPIPNKGPPNYYIESGNSALGAALATGLDVRHHSHVQEVRNDGTIQMRTRGPNQDVQVSSHGPFDLIIVTAPLPQAAAILQAPPPTVDDWNEAFAPTLTALLAYDISKIPTTSPVHSSAAGRPPFAILADDMWVGCEGFKRPARDGRVIFVAQASESFSDMFVDRPDNDWLPLIRRRAEELWHLPENARISSFAKRWRYSRLRSGRNALSQACPWAKEHVLVSGDGVHGASGVQEAILQGLKTAQTAKEILGTQ